MQEYERAVIFRLGRVLPGAKGPGLFFILPCIDDIVRVDLRTFSFDVPPQEVLHLFYTNALMILIYVGFGLENEALVESNILLTRNSFIYTKNTKNNYANSIH